jgi:hypothetical protein
MDEFNESFCEGMIRCVKENQELENDICNDYYPSTGVVLK